jgi:hypothetical protein
MKRIFALSIGVGTYVELPNLKCPAADAKGFSDVLQSGSEQTQTRLITDQQATKSAIIEGVKWLSANAGRDDTAMFFFSGHGGRQSSSKDAEAFLCPANASLSDHEKTCITSQELNSLLSVTKSKRIIMLLDTCYSGGMRDGNLRNLVVSGFEENDVNSMLDGSGRVVLAACRPDQAAWELNGMANGLFSHYLLRALRGEAARADGSIWASNVFSFASEGVRKHGCQTPFQRWVGADFIMLKQKERLTSAQSKIDARKLRKAMHSVYTRDEISLLCRDFGLTLDDLPGRILETQIMDFIDHCEHHGKYENLLTRVKADRPQLVLT